MSPYIAELMKAGKSREMIVSRLLQAFKASSELDKMGVDLELKLTFDVKAQKKLSRSDDKPSDSFTWLELKKPGGGAGWAVAELSDYIVFESSHSWLVVESAKIKELVLKNVIREYVHRPEPWYCYKRAESGTQYSVITLAPLDQIRAIASIVIAKDES